MNCITLTVPISSTPASSIYVMTYTALVTGGYLGTPAWSLAGYAPFNTLVSAVFPLYIIPSPSYNTYGYCYGDANLNPTSSIVQIAPS